MNKAKKRKPSPLVPESNAPMEPVAIENPVPSPLPDPEPAPAHATSADDAAQTDVDVTAFTASVIDARLLAAKIAFMQAEIDVLKREKKWAKVRKTYVESGKYSHYDDESIVARVKERLLTADGELANARLTRMRTRVKWVRLRTYRNLRLRWLETGGSDLVIDGFYRRAQRRLSEPLPEPKWTSMWPGIGHDMYEWLQGQYGLAVTWGMMHVDDL